MSKLSLLLFIVFLSSSASSQEKRPGSSQNLALGMVNIQTVAVGGGESHLKSGVVVRLTSRVTKVQSYALSNAAGIVVVPLPPGSYCYDAFSQAGQPLQMKRPSRERCFSVKKGQVAEVGVEFNDRERQGTTGNDRGRTTGNDRGQTNDRTTGNDRGQTGRSPSLKPFRQPGAPHVGLTCGAFDFSF
jgi:hypothetical protein